MRRIAAVLAVAVGSFVAPVGAGVPENPSSARFAAAAAQEREAAARLVALERALPPRASATAEQRSSAARERVPADAERALQRADAGVNRALEELYGGAWRSAGGDDAELRAGLLHWTVLLRRALMGSLHTRVPGLVDDPDCAGDLVGDELVLDYFEALLARDEAAAVRSLAHLARQSACLGVAQSRFLAGAFVSSFEELRLFLRLHGREDLVPYLVQAASNPLLLFHDVEKRRGSEAPLARWFAEHAEILVDGVRTGRHPAVWHGLWLYDRRSGRLLGYRQASRPRDENEVDLARFFASIVQPENLGGGACNLSEMVERGVGPLGYLCAGSTCDAGAAGPGGRTATGTVPDGVRPGLTGLAATFARAVCTGGGGGPGASGDVPSCGELPVVGGRAATTARCLTEQVVHAGTEGLHCLGESTGRCSAPPDSLVKGLEPQAMAGIKIGRDCARAVGMGDVKVAERDQEEREKREREGRRQEIQRLEKLITTYEESIAEDQARAAAENEPASLAYQSYLQARAAAEQAGRDPDTDPTVLAAKQHAEETAARAEAARLATNETIRAAALLKAKAEEDLRKQKEKQAQEEAEGENGGDGGGERCAREDTDCGDACTAMSQGTRDLLACVEDALSGDQQDPLRQGGPGCDPLLCDPIEPDATAAGAPACLGVLGESPSAAASKLCWAVRCAPGETPVAGGGACTCRDGGGLQPSRTGGVGSFCDKILCGEGTPTYQGGRCTCGGSAVGGGPGGVGAGGPLLRELEPVLGEPPTFSDVRYGPRP